MSVLQWRRENDSCWSAVAPSGVCYPIRLTDSGFFVHRAYRTRELSQLQAYLAQKVIMEQEAVPPAEESGAKLDWRGDAHITPTGVSKAWRATSQSAPATSWVVYANDQGQFVAYRSDRPEATHTLPTLQKAQEYCGEEDGIPGSNEVWGCLEDPLTWRRVLGVVTGKYHVQSMGQASFFRTPEEWRAWVKDVGAVRLEGEGVYYKHCDFCRDVTRFLETKRPDQIIAVSPSLRQGGYVVWYRR
jgi:hypothetical protein